MKLSLIIELLNAKVVSGKIEEELVETGFSSDLMSDVLTLDTDKMLLITGMANLQAIRTAEMADIHCILLVRNKRHLKKWLNWPLNQELLFFKQPCHRFVVAGYFITPG